MFGSISNVIPKLFFLVESYLKYFYHDTLMSKTFFGSSHTVNVSIVIHLSLTGSTDRDTGHCLHGTSRVLFFFFLFTWPANT